jgi:hypothetical protein
MVQENKREQLVSALILLQYSVLHLPFLTIRETTKCVFVGGRGGDESKDHEKKKKKREDMVRKNIHRNETIQLLVCVCKLGCTIRARVPFFAVILGMMMMITRRLRGGDVSDEWPWHCCCCCCMRMRRADWTPAGMMIIETGIGIGGPVGGSFGSRSKSRSRREAEKDRRCTNGRQWDVGAFDTHR